MSSLSPFENLEIIRGRTKRYVPCKDPPQIHNHWITGNTFVVQELCITQGCCKIFPFIKQKKFFLSSLLHLFPFCSGSRSVVMAQLSITSLGLRSLKEITGGDVVIIKNQNLCYTDKKHWKRLFKSESQSATIEDNADSTTCGKLEFDPFVV